MTTDMSEYIKVTWCGLSFQTLVCYEGLIICAAKAWLLTPSLLNRNHDHYWDLPLAHYQINVLKQSINPRQDYADYVLSVLNSNDPALLIRIKHIVHQRYRFL